MRDRRALGLTAVLLLLGVLVTGILAGAAEEKVAFNVETMKYHCRSCRWAIKCTRNCIEVPLSEAKRRGGIACKVCGGTCG